MSEQNEVKNDAAFDAADFEIAEDATAEVQIYHPKTKADTGMFFTVYSKESSVAKKVLRKQQDRRLMQMKRGRGGLSLSADELENEKYELIVACIKDLRNVKYKGSDVVLADVKELLQKVPAIREQIEDAIDDRELFTKG